MRDTKRPLYVAVCYPSQTFIYASFAISLSGLLLQREFCGNRFDIDVINPQSSIVAIARNNGIERAKKDGVDYILFLDSDMIFPADTLIRLLSHKKDVVGCVYRKRVAPYAILGAAARGAVIREDNLLQMDQLPTGCMLIKMSVFDLLPKPYFCYGTTKEGEIIGEDYIFSAKLSNAAIELWSDMLLSTKLEHAGESRIRVELDD